MAKLDLPDRCWLVAGLTLAGLTAEDIADRLHCSLRLVRSIRAENMTQVCILMQRESRNFTAELHLVRSELCTARQDNAEQAAELARTKNKLNRMIDAQIVGHKLCGKCAAPMDHYNTYVHPKTGKEYCRSCHRRRQKDYRDLKRSGPGCEAREIREGTQVRAEVFDIMLSTGVTA